MAGNKENTTGSSAIPELSRDLAPTTTRSSADEKGDHSDYIKSEGGDDVEKGFPGKKGSVWGAMTSPLRSGAAISTVTEQGDRHVRMQRERTLERQHSVVASFTSPRSPVDPAARVPAEFRTLSIQLSEGGLAEKTKRKKETKAVKDLDDLDWHKLSSAEILTRLGASPSSGLDSQQAKRRLDQYGKNQMSKPPNRWARKAFSYIFGGFGSFLLVASILCFVAWKPLGNPNPQASNLALAIVLIVVLALQSLFNTWQDFTTSRVMASISGMLPSDVIVLRDGNRISIPASDLVRGDIVCISLGNKMPADLRLLELSGDLKFDRSVLTGESEAIAATVDATDDNFLETRNVALAGTHCTSGAGLGVVIQTGDDTVFGRIAKMTSKPKTDMTTLQKEIFIFVVYISTLAITLAVICIIIWGAYLRPKHPDFMSVSQLIVNVVSILVAFIPEGLPIAVTLSLTVIANAMRESKVLCKSLGTVETLGSVNVICSDKTGTLTQNRMFVANAAILGMEATVTDAHSQIIVGGPVGQAYQQLQFVAGVCNAAVFDAATNDLPLAQRKIHGDATDTAILRMAEEMGGVEAANAGWQKLYELSFNSKNKFMLKLMKSDSADLSRALSPPECNAFTTSDMVLLSKGAPDVLLKRCGSALDASGNVLPLTDSIKDQLVATQSDWSSRGQRVLLLARRIVNASLIDPSLSHDSSAFADRIMELNTELTVVGMVGIVDPPRPEIPSVVKTCRGAGIRFFMVTGDFQLTAVAIARQCGIVTAEKVHTIDELDRDIAIASVPKYDVYADNEARPQRALSLTGSDLMKLNENQWEQACQYDEIVFSRTTPEQKLRIVKELQSRDGVVGMTGDGVNDAPSLKQADVGIAMGGGSDVAMEAADMILLDSFASIIDALLYGRLCFDNLKKSIMYLLPAGSFAELWAVLLSFFFGLPQILSNIQMILICVGTDLAPSLSMTQEKGEADLLTRKPRNVKKDRLADWKLLLHAYVFVGLPTTLASAAMGFWWMQRHGVHFSDMWLKYGGGYVQTNFSDRFNEVLYQAQSVYFFNLVLMQWGNLLCERTRRLSIFQHPPIGNRLTSNYYLFPAMAIALIIAVFFSYIPGIQKAFLTRGVTVEHYFLPIAFGVGMLVLEELRKLAVRTYPNGLLAKIAW